MTNMLAVRQGNNFKQCYPEQGCSNILTNCFCLFVCFLALHYQLEKVTLSSVLFLHSQRRSEIFNICMFCTSALLNTEPGAVIRELSETQLQKREQKTTHSPQTPICSPPRAPVILYRHGEKMLPGVSHAEMHNAHVHNCTRVILFCCGD